MPYAPCPMRNALNPDSGRITQNMRVNSIRSLHIALSPSDFQLDILFAK